MVTRTNKWEGVVTRATLPIRKNPNAKAGTHSYSPAYKGDTVWVCDTAKGWYYINIGGKYGYVSSKWIKYKASAPEKRKPSKTVRWIGKTTKRVTLRTVPRGKTGTIAAYVPRGTVVSVCDTVDGFWYVKCGLQYGYISARYVTYTAAAGDVSAKVAEFLAAVKATQEYARKRNYIWADSRSKVPASDGKISCDRLVARALWDLGYTDQIKGGIALGRDFEGYLMKHGFKRSTSMDAVKAGSVLVVMNPSGSSRHVFVVASRKGDTFTRYDCGSTEWIRSRQPLQGLWMSRLIAVYNIS